VEVLAASGAIEEAERKALLDSDYEVSALLHSIAENGEPTTLGVLAGGGIQIGPFGSQLHAADYSTDGVPVLMPADLRQRGFDNSAIRRVSECKAQELSNHRLQEGDIVLPRRGELNKRAIISAAEAGWLCGTGSVRVRLQDPTLAPLVLEILAFRESVQWLVENAVGTTMPNLNRDIVARIPLRLPPQESRVLWVKRLTAARVLSEALTHSVSTSTLRTASLREALLEFDHV
jgi:type I restriction enzyme S subunit